MFFLFLLVLVIALVVLVVAVVIVIVLVLVIPVVVGGGVVAPATFPPRGAATSPGASLSAKLVAR